MKGSSRDPGRRGVRMGITSVKQPNNTGAPSSAVLLNGEQIQSAVEDALSSTPFIDVHTHLFSPAFGMPTGSSALEEARAFFRTQSIEEHIRNVLRIAGVSDVVMTNDPLDPEEQPAWLNGGQKHAKFHAALRLDRILWGWPRHWQQLASQGYAVEEKATGKSVAEVRRFLSDWHERMRPLYMAVSLTDEFQFPDESITSKMLAEAVLPSCREFGLPMSLMIGVRRQVNPRLRLAGDAVGKADLRAVENLCRAFPENRFLVSVLSREIQQSDALRMLVVHEQSFDCGGNHARAD